MGKGLAEAAVEVEEAVAVVEEAIETAGEGAVEASTWSP